MALLRHVTVALLLLSLLHNGVCLLCSMCIPPVVGDAAAKRAASLMRANVSRTFNGLAESEIQECDKFTANARNGQMNCGDELSMACLRYDHPAWTARTCGYLPSGDSGDMLCPPGPFGEECWACATSLCNGAERTRPAPVAAAALTAALVALMATRHL